MERDPSLREDLGFEGVVVGEVWRTPSHQVSDKDISDFAAVTDDHHSLETAFEKPLDESLSLKGKMLLFQSEDRRGGVRAFVEKRAPRWMGRLRSR